MTSPVQWRKKRRRRRRPFNPAILFAFLGLMFLFGIYEESAQSPRATRIIRTVPESYSFADYKVPVIQEPVEERVIYPYSVVRGGVHSRDELLREINRDPVVANHYSGFDASDARIVRVQDAKQVHVSYRINDKVFWSARKITLARGEALISDGQNLARVRCGNRVSVVPQEPVSAEEPAPEVFNTPTIVVQPDIIDEPTIPDVTAPLFSELTSPTTIHPPETMTLADSFPPVYPDFFVTPDFYEGPEVPEPGTLILVGSALAVHLLLRRFAFKRKADRDSIG